MPQQLAEAPEFPEGLRYLWGWHCEIAGQNRLSYAELDAWARLTGTAPMAWEVEILMGLDRLFWSAMND